MQLLAEGLNDILKNALERKEFSLKDLMKTMEPIFVQNGFRLPKQEKNIALLHILVIRLDEIGDNVLTSGFLRELRRDFPKAQITLLVNPIVYSLVELCPYVNAVYSFPAANGSFVEQYQAAVVLCKDKLWKHRYDLCFCPRWDFDRYFALLLGYMSGARERIAYSEKLYAGKAQINAGFDQLLTKVVVNPPQLVHEAERNYFMLEAMHLPVREKHMELWYDREDEAFATAVTRAFLRGRTMLVVSIGANEANKMYPKEGYAAAMQQLLQVDDLCFVLLGGRQEINVTAWVENSLPKNTVLNLAGKTTLRQSAAILQIAQLYLGNDTGLKHMAAAANLPVIEINREAADCASSLISLYERFFPWETPTISLRPKHALDNCRGVISQAGCIAPQAHCICQITPEEIVEAYQALKRIRIKK